MKNLVAIIFSLLALESTAQLELYQNTPNFLVEYEFLGSDYSVFNVQFTGNSSSYAQFNGANTNIGLSRGFVLSTGNALDSSLIGPNDSENVSSSMGAPGYPNLSSLIVGNTFDAAVLEFDFIPSVDSLAIRFVFGSEEYEESVGGQFNDLMAVFLSGPNIPGPSPLNIALLPDNSFICPNNVHRSVSNTFGIHPAVNNLSYVHNPVSSQGLPDKIQLDGFTVPLTAFTDTLIPGETYHLVLAIADAGDDIYDAAVFFEVCPSCNYTLNTEEITQKLNVFPNPAATVINVPKGVETYSIFNLSGKLLQSGEVINSQEIDVHELVSGVYLLQTNLGTTRFVIR